MLISPERNLSNADLRTANLFGCKFDGVLLEGTLISEGSMPEKIELVHALVNGYVFSAPGADLTYANLSGLKVEGLNLSGANLSEAKILGSNMRHSNLESVQLTRAQIHRSDFADTQLNEVDFSHADIASCRFFSADLSEASFSGASCRESNFANALLRNAKDLRGLNLKPSALKGADTTGSDLECDTTYDDEGAVLDLALVKVLEAKVDGLRHGSESDYPYEIRFWPASRGEFTTEAFLLSIGHLHKLDVEVLFAPASPARTGQKSFLEMLDLYSGLLETIVDDLQDYELFELGYKGDPDPSWNNFIFLARTKNGAYFGFAPTYERYGGYSIEAEVQFSDYQICKAVLSNNQALAEKVQRATTNCKTKIRGVKQSNRLQNLLSAQQHA